MPTGKLRYCWDSCVFISLLTGSGRSAEDLENLRKLEALSDLGAITIFSPSITLVEVLACKLTPDQDKVFSEFLQRSNVLLVSVTSRVAERAREIRNYYRVQGMEIAVPDAIHLATALIYSATALHTYDGCGKRSRPTDLLRLPIPLLGKYPLRICKPEPPLPDKPEPAIPIGATTGDLFASLEESSDDDEEAQQEEGEAEVES